MFVFIVLDIIFLVLCLLAAFIDIKARLIPNKLILLSLLLVILKIIFSIFYKTFNITIFLGGFSLALLFIGIPYLINQSIGAGDLKLVCLSGAFLGLQGAFTYLCSSFISCACFALILNLYCLIRKKPRAKTLPFAPFLFIGFFYAIIINYL